MRSIQSLQNFGFIMRDVDAGNSLCECVPTDFDPAQRGKLFEGQFHDFNSESQTGHNTARAKTMKAIRGRITLQGTSCEMPPRFGLFQTPHSRDFRSTCASAPRFCLKSGSEPHLESDVRDLPAEVRSVLSSAFLRFPSASTPLPV